MSWINENRNFIRPIILIVFVVTLIGPWMFDQINVPAEYACDKPFIRLEGDFCGSPLSGFQFFSLFTGGFFQMIVEMFKGNFAGSARELLVGLPILLLIPFFYDIISDLEKRFPPRTDYKSEHVEPGIDSGFAGIWTSTTR